MLAGMNRDFERRRCAYYIAALVAVAFACSGEERSGDGSSGNVVDAGTSRDAGGEAECEVWLVDYDLTGSQLEVRGVPGGDRTKDVGPGALTLQYPAVDGERADGEVAIVAYMLDLDFEESGIVTDIETYAGPDACGMVTGSRSTSTVTWSGDLTDHHARGTVTCTADELFCGFVGLPKDEPQSRDSDEDLPLSSFYLDASGFDSDFVEIDDGGNIGDTFLRLRGTETSSRCVARPTGC